MGWPHRVGKPCNAWTHCWLSGRQTAGLYGIHWQLEGLQGKPGVFIIHTQGKKINSCFLPSPVVCKQKLELYKWVLRNSWKGHLPTLGVQICSLETSLWIWIQFAGAPGKLLFSEPPWGHRISQDTFPFTWVVSAPWKEYSFCWEKTHSVHGADVGQFNNTRSPNTSALWNTYHGSVLFSSWVLSAHFQSSVIKDLMTYWSKQKWGLLPRGTWSNGKSYLLVKGHLVLPSMPTAEDKTDPFDSILFLQHWFPLCCWNITWVWLMFPI